MMRPSSAQIGVRHVLLGVLSLTSSLLVVGCRSEVPEGPSVPQPMASSVPGDWGDTEHAKWTAARELRSFEFPRDHGSHDDFRIEWWYYTGNLQSADGRRFGYQLTFFRTGMRRDNQNPSPWAVRDLYIAHFAIADVQSRRHTHFERTNRSAIGWAGADEQGRRVWNGNWQLTLSDDARTHTLEAEQDGVALQLELEATEPPVLHGERGLSRKGAADGNASYYYSLPRLRTSGRVIVGGESFPVDGLSWMDHEFSSSFLEEGQLGWDWFSMQFDDGDALMLYQMRRVDGTKDPHSSGTWMSASEPATILDAADFELQPFERWRSPSTSSEYPIRWRVQVPKLKLDVEVEAVFAEQEMDTQQSTGIVYWEGCVDIRGTRDGRPVTGRGYLEMTGRRRNDE